MGYTLIIAEKPASAEQIAKALDRENEPQACRERGVPYYVVEKEGGKAVVVPALGHLYTVVPLRRRQGKGKRTGYPVFAFRWAPIYLAKRSAHRIKAWIEVISELASGADVFVDACDYDVEGSLIGYNILEYACGKACVAKRMKYSTLTRAELEKAYENLSQTLDFTLIEAGRARHEIDWLYGVNLSRALTLAVKRARLGYATLSTGRVQGPTLRFLALRERAIACFVPTPYWTITAQVLLEGKIYEAEYEERIVVKAEADSIVDGCRGKMGRIAKIEERTYAQNPPVPFDLGALQREAYSVFGFNPRRTAKLAERLYLDALISYPRTSSQKLPPSIGYRSIITRLSKRRTYKRLASQLLKFERLKPAEGRKEDPAHPAVYPTGKLPDRRLDNSRRKLWDLVVRRFLATFGEPAVKQRANIKIAVSGFQFHLMGHKILKEGWMSFYKPYARLDEVLLPKVEERERVEVAGILCEDRFTKPRPRYNPSSILRKMEKEGIGTKATRANIIQTLHNRKYIIGESIRVTELGQRVTQVLQKHAPQIASVELTRELEEKMRLLQDAKEKREDVVEEAANRLKPILEELKKNEDWIGQALGRAIRDSRLQERTIGVCPTCKTGKLVIIRSRKTGKRFVGCTNYFEGRCKTSFPLPQRGSVKPTGGACSLCGWPTIAVFRRGKRPWMLCFNPSCPRKAERKKVEVRNMR